MAFRVELSRIEGRPGEQALMDVTKTLRELYEEKRRLDAAIRTLEAHLTKRPVRPPARRGRKSMSAEERRAVSERMRRYWENRRGEGKAHSGGQAKAVSA